MFKVGARVRSHDFPHEKGSGARAFYIEGLIESIEWKDECERYKIRVEKDVFAGEVLDKGHEATRLGQYVYPPVDALECHGSPYSGVEMI